MTEDEMFGWHHQLNDFEQASGVGEGQGTLACCRPWACKELEMTEQLNNNTFEGRNLVTFIIKLLRAYPNFSHAEQVQRRKLPCHLRSSIKKQPLLLGKYQNICFLNRETTLILSSFLLFVVVLSWFMFLLFLSFFISLDSLCAIFVDP